MKRTSSGTERSGEYVRAPLDAALVSIERGELRECAASGEVRERLEEFGATLPELCGALDRAFRQRIAAQLVGSATASLGEVVLLSAEHIYVVRPLSGSAELALVSVSSTMTSMGKILSDVHAAVAKLDTEQ